MGREPSRYLVCSMANWVADVIETVRGVAVKDRDAEEAQPFLHGPVAGDYEIGDTMPAALHLVEVCGLLTCGLASMSTMTRPEFLANNFVLFHLVRQGEDLRKW